MTNKPGQIQITTGTFTSDTCTKEYDLIANAQKKPEIRAFLEYANKRAITTLITSGAVSPYGINNMQKTKLPEVSTKGRAIGSNGYQFNVMGRIEKASVILSQVGATAADKSFQLLMQDRHLVNGMNCIFHGSRFVGLVRGNPQPAQGGFIYTFDSPSGETFSWATHVAPQAGTKTCMGAYTSFGEGSRRGDGRSKFPDTFINHTTIQRKTVGITGTAASQILWLNYTSADGSGSSKGWMYQEVQQARATFIYENERQKLFGVSTMKNADGTAKVTPDIYDQEGNPIIAGDGWEEQVAGGIVVSGSGVNGEATVDDFTDVMTALEQNSDQIDGCMFVAITGTDGYANAQTQMAALGVVATAQYHTNIPNSNEVGGAKVAAGYHWSSFNVNGNQMLFIKHPLFDDKLMWTERGADGKILMSSTYFIMDIGEGANKNMEILYKSVHGLDRSMVEAKFNGMTGDSELALSEEDAMKFAMLKEDMLVIYNTSRCAIIRKSA